MHEQKRSDKYRDGVSFRVCDEALAGARPCHPAGFWYFHWMPCYEPAAGNKERIVLSRKTRGLSPWRCVPRVTFPTHSEIPTGILSARSVAHTSSAHSITAVSPQALSKDTLPTGASPSALKRQDLASNDERGSPSIGEDRNNSVNDT